jgi:amino acid transporter
MAQLKRTLGIAECIFFGVGSILGAGIYTLIGKVAGVAGNMVWLSFLIASVTALFTAFSYAELSAAIPKAGAEYAYTKKAMSKKIGVFLGFIISINGIVSGSTVAIGFAGYLRELLSVNLLVAALGLIVLIFLVNVSGIRQSSTINIIFTIIEAGGLIFVLYCAVSSIGKVNITELPPEGMNGLMTAAALAFFAFIGFEEIVKLAEETKKPEKAIPIALFTACFIVAVMYTAVSISAISAVPYEELGESESPMAHIVEVRFGNTGVIVISVVALFATANTVLSNMLGSSRVLLDMGKEVKALSRLGKVSEKGKTPIAALILITIVMGAFALIGDIEIVARIAAIFIFITFIMVNLSVIFLRVKDKEMKRPFRIPLNINNIPVISVLGILCTLVLFGYNLYDLLKSGAE